MQARLVAVREASRRVAGLDALRGVAIGLVLLRHALPDLFGGAGIVGVLIFFVLSGYLITSLLLKDLSRYRRVRYGRFYRNRAIRLLPPLAFLLIGVCVVSLLANPLGDRAGLGRSLFLALTYTANLPIDLGSPAIAHLWTLSTEEQFYLLWPLLLGLSFKRSSYRLLLATAVPAIVVALALTLVLSAPNFERIYGLFTSWAIGLVIGAACAIYRSQLMSVFSHRMWAIALTASGVAITVACLLPEPKSQWWGYLVLGPMASACAAIWVLRLSNAQSVPRAFGPLLWLATISYAAYLWNYPATLWLEASDIPSASLWAVPLTLLLAQLSWWVVETPFNRLRAYLDRRSSTATPTPSTSLDSRLADEGLA